MQNTCLDDLQPRIKITKRNINTSGTILMAEFEEKQMSLLMRVKGNSEKASLKLNIQKSKIMASSLITSWQIDGEKAEKIFFSWAQKSLWMVTTALN